MSETRGTVTLADLPARLREEYQGDGPTWFYVQSVATRLGAALAELREQIAQLPHERTFSNGVAMPVEAKLVLLDDVLALLTPTAEKATKEK